MQIYTIMIKKWNNFNKINNFDVINESKLEDELKNQGYSVNEIPELMDFARKGELGKTLSENGKNLTFGLLHAIYKDCIKAKRTFDLKSGSVKMMVRITPIILGPISTIMWIIGTALGATRAVNKILNPILTEPGYDYPEFLKKLISSAVSVAEGEINGDDPIKRAFVVSDGLVDMLDGKVVSDFTHFLCEKMSKEESDQIVPDYYIENELRDYLNKTFKLEPGLDKKD